MEWILTRILQSVCKSIPSGAGLLVLRSFIGDFPFPAYVLSDSSSEADRIQRLARHYTMQSYQSDRSAEPSIPRALPPAALRRRQGRDAQSYHTR